MAKPQPTGNFCQSSYRRMLYFEVLDIKLCLIHAGQVLYQGAAPHPLSIFQGNGKYSPQRLFQKVCTYLHNWSLSFFSSQKLFWTQNVLFRSWFIRQRTEESCFRYLAEPRTVSIYSCRNLCCPFWFGEILFKVHSWIFFPSRSSSRGHWNSVLEEVKLAVCPCPEHLLSVLYHPSIVLTRSSVGDS